MWSSFRNVFLHLPPLISAEEKLKRSLEQGTTTKQINEFQQSAGIRRSVLKPHQVKQSSFLWTLRWRKIQTHMFPWLKSLSPKHSRCMVRALLHQQELRDGRMKRNGKKDARKNSHRRSQEQHNHAVSLSISKFNFMLYIKGVRVRAPHPPFGSIQCFSTGGGLASLWLSLY